MFSFAWLQSPTITHNSRRGRNTWAQGMEKSTSCWATLSLMSIRYRCPSWRERAVPFRDLSSSPLLSGTDYPPHSPPLTEESQAERKLKESQAWSGDRIVQPKSGLQPEGKVKGFRWKSRAILGKIRDSIYIFMKYIRVALMIPKFFLFLAVD